MDKKFLLKPEEIKQLTKNYGACIASDKITVEGYPIRFMYRNDPVDEVDSGWSFLSGFESEEYMEDADNHGVFDVNTIANYDESIIPLLDSPAGSAFEKTPESEIFVDVSSDF